MNNIQKIISAISGYNPSEFYQSAKDEFYYELSSKEEKMNQINDYAEQVYEISLTQQEIESVYEFLENMEEWSSNETAINFSNLKT